MSSRRSSVPSSNNQRKLSSTTTSTTFKSKPAAVQKQSSSPPDPGQSVVPVAQPPSLSSASPLVLTPISQLPKASRRNSRTELPDKPTPWDPEHFNPDGSLRTVHRMPGFEQAYAQAQKARYIRHRNVIEREKELSVNQIFDKS